MYHILFIITNSIPRRLSKHRGFILVIVNCSIIIYGNENPAEKYFLEDSPSVKKEEAIQIIKHFLRPSGVFTVFASNKKSLTVKPRCIIYFILLQILFPEASASIGVSFQ